MITKKVCFLVFTTLCLVSVSEHSLQAKMPTSYKVAGSTVLLSSIVGALGWIYKNNLQKKHEALERELKELSLAKNATSTFEKNAHIQTRLAQVHKQLAHYENIQTWIKRALVAVGIIGGLGTASTIAHYTSKSKEMIKRLGIKAFEEVVNDKLEETYNNEFGGKNSSSIFNLRIKDPLNTGRLSKKRWRQVLKNDTDDYDFRVYGQCYYELPGNQFFAYHNEVEEPEEWIASANEFLAEPGDRLSELMSNKNHGLQQLLSSFRHNKLEMKPEDVIRETMEKVEEQKSGWSTKDKMKAAFLGRSEVDEDYLRMYRDSLINALKGNGSQG